LTSKVHARCNRNEPICFSRYIASIWNAIVFDRRDDMFKKPASVAIRLPMLIGIACCIASGIVLAQDVTPKDAIQCKDFKRTADGSWYAESASLNYGPGQKQQMNLFGATIRKGQAKAGEPDLWTLLNEKCGVAH
jgi:hypothetical protein